MPTTLLSDCTNATMQSMNKDSNGSEHSTAKTPPTTIKRIRHNPYVSLIAPEDSVSSSMSSYPSPLQWTKSGEGSPYDGYYYESSPYHFYEASYLNYCQTLPDVSRPLFGNEYPPRQHALPEPHNGGSSSPNTSLSENHHLQPRNGSTNATPMKGLSRIYVSGRPKVVRRRHTAEVTVALRCGEAAFNLPDVYAVFPPEVAMDSLVGHYVLVEGDRGVDMGPITEVLRSDVVEGDAAESSTEDSTDGNANHPNSNSGKGNNAELPKVLSLADERDMASFDALDAAEEEALLHCRACVTAARMPVPISVERAIFQFDRQKLTLQYTSDSYVDFKALTRALHSHHKCRIWMHQLNRDATRSSNAQRGDRNHGGAGFRKNANHGNKSNGNHHCRGRTGSA